MKQLSLVAGKIGYPKDFEAFWKLYPRREGANPKHPAFMAYQRARKTTDAETILRAVDAYLKELGDQIGTRYVCHAQTWLNQRRWQDQEQSAGTTQADPEHLRWQSRVKGWDRSGFWMKDQWGPPPDSPYFKGPADLSRKAQSILSAG
jgi:hypothetical protein